MGIATFNISWKKAMRKSQLWALGLVVCACAKAEPPTLPAWVTTEKNISYDRYRETVLDVLQPANALPGKRPGVLLIHGGGWVGGSKEAVAVPFGLPYLEKGFVVANISYRLAPGSPAPAAVEDVLKAARWFRDRASKYNVDPHRIVVAGDSAGGHLALMAGMVPRSAGFGVPVKVAAVVNFYGITDVGEQIEGPGMRDYAAQWVPEQPDRRRLAHRLSPASYVRRKLPPILTVHGDEDPVVPYEQGIRLTKDLVTLNATAELIPVRRGEHGFPPEEMASIYKQIFDFLRRVRVLTD
jgi:acetyl esterase/lipase